MRKSLRYLPFLVMINIFSITAAFAQVITINGNVKSGLPVKEYLPFL